MQRRCLLEVRHSAMKVYLVNSNWTDQGILSFGDLDAELAQLKIIVPIKKSVVVEVFEKLKSGETIEDTCIAEGQEVYHGKNGYVEWFVNVSGNVEQKDIDYDANKIDFKEQIGFTSVAKGEDLGCIHPPSDGVDGYDVYGNSIPARKGFAFNIVLQEGVEKVANLIRATAMGIPHFKQRKISVHNCVIVKEDVGPTTGNIDVKTCVHILGSVTEGYSVKSKESIYIGGNAHDCQLESGTDLSVMGGVHGREDYPIRVGGDFICRFIEGGDFEVAGNIHVRKDILRANVQSLESIDVGGDIIGGSVSALKSVSATCIGTEVGVKTKVSVLKHYDYERFLRIRNNILLDLNTLDTLYPENMRRSFSEEEKVTLTEYIRKLETEQLPQLKKLEQMIFAFAQIFDSVSRPYINTRRICYPDVLIQIADSRLVLREAINSNSKFVREKEFGIIEVLRA